MSSLNIHAIFKKALEESPVTLSDDDDHKRGTVWFMQTKPVTLRPGGVARVTGVPKFQGMPSTKAILLDSPDEPADQPRFPEQLLVRPELQKSTVVMSKRITVLVRNASSQDITLTRGTAIAHLFPVDVVSSH